MNVQQLIDIDNTKRFVIWHIPQNQKTQWGFILFSGLGENLCDLDYFMKYLATDLCDNGILTLQIDLFGHGESSGDFDSIDESVLIQDIRHAVSLLRGKGISKIGIITRGYISNLYPEIVEGNQISMFIGISPIMLNESAREEFLESYKYDSEQPLFSGFDSIEKSDTLITMLGSEPQNLYTERINKLFWEQIVERISSSDCPVEVEGVNTIWFSFNLDENRYFVFEKAENIPEKTLPFYFGYAFPRSIVIESDLRLRLLSLICRRVMEEI
ncbi:MAG: hypothetical protein IKX68_09570 [Clostridiales bacterium]|nr:hypothetical protein [Clostridiales bacterium]